MKNKVQKIAIIIFAFISASTFNSKAQAPQKISYQTVIRNTSNAIVASAPVGIQISILQGSASGPAVYVETHAATTNINGLASLEIGGGTLVSGSMVGIDWSAGPYFIKTETDPLGGTAYTITGTTQLLSVPYALQANSLSKPLGKTYLIITGNKTNAQVAAQIAEEVGPNTQFVWIQNTSGVSNIILTGLTNLVQIIINGNADLTSLAFPSLNTLNITNIFFGLSSISNNPLLNNISLPNLTEIYSGFTIENNISLTSIFLPNLTNNSGSIVINANNILTSITFPLLNYSNSLSIEYCPLLSSITFPNLSNIYSLSISYCAALNSISIPALTTLNLGIYFYTNNLSSASVNSILNQCLSISPISGKNIYLPGQTPSAPPTGSGITDKATLIANGANVTTD